MLKLTITIEGKTANDLSLALEAVTESVENGNTMGMDSNDSGSYGFEISGEEMKKLDNQETKSLNLFKPQLTQVQHDRVLKWARALESGVYHQGTRIYCRVDNTHDVFGVANDIFEFNCNTEQDYLTPEAMEKLGMATESGSVDNSPDCEELDLGYINDEIMDFNELAQLLRDQLEFSSIVG